MRKKMLMTLGLCLMFAGSMNTLYAADESPFITFDGDAQEYFDFSTDQNALTDKFEGMMPGESRSEVFTLVNNDERELSFFLNTDVLKDLGEDNKAIGAVYNITFKRDGEVFYEGTVGGENGSLVDLSGQSMGESMLMATLNQNERTEIEMTIGLDGDSMDNAYQNATGQLQFVFSVQQDDPVVQEPTIVEKVVQLPGKEIERVVEGVNTGNYTVLAPYAIAIVVAAGLIIIVMKKRKDDKKEEMGS